MPRWKLRLLRAAGATSLTVGLTGLTACFAALVLVTLGFGVPQHAIYFYYVFPIICGFAVLWYAFCSLSGAYLWRGDVRGYRLAKFLVRLQVVYSLIFWSLYVFRSGYETVSVKRNFGISEAMGGAFREVDNGLALSYSLILLFVLVVFFRKADFRPDTLIAGDRNGSKTNASRVSAPGFIYVIRGLGLANLVFGLLLALVAILYVVSGRLLPSVLSHTHFSREGARLGSAINVIIAVASLFAGYLLVRLDRKGVTIANSALGAGAVYWFAATLAPRLHVGLPSFWFWVLYLIRAALTPSLSSLASYGLTPRILTAYPLVALPLLNWGAKRLDQGQMWKRTPSKDRGAIAPAGGGGGW